MRASGFRGVASALVLALALAVAACGGGGGGNAVKTAPSSLPKLPSSPAHAWVQEAA